MSKHDGCERGFSVFSEAWYSKNQREPGILEEIMVGMYSQDRGTSGEFGIRWTKLCGKATPRLEVFDDAWSALFQFGDMLAWMASVDGRDISPQEFAQALRGMGIKDRTERDSPHTTSPGEREYASWIAEVRAAAAVGANLESA